MDRQGIVLVVQIVIYALLGGLAVLVSLGWRETRSANQIPFFRLKRERVSRGWRFIFLGILMGVVAAGLQIFGIGVVEGLVPVTSGSQSDDRADHSATTADTTTPTRSSLETPTATITPTPTERGTPTIPEAIIALFDESVTPDAQAVFGPITVATEVSYPAFPDDEVFETVEGILYGLFSYDFLEPGVRWTAVWLWEDEIACVDTKPWDGEIGGWGYTECELDQWPAGEYFIHMFLGQEWMISAQFMVLQTAGQEEEPSPTPTQ
jgi:hypothetical protein